MGKKLVTDKEITAASKDILDTFSQKCTQFGKK